MKRISQVALALTLLLAGLHVKAQDMAFNSPRTGNPLLPGYFADPTIVKFGDTFYIFATTDGIRLASGPPTVWKSKDFVNWFNQRIEIPFTVPRKTNIWAPDLVVGPDGRFYFSHGNCEAGCNVYKYVSDSPLGPWKNIVGENIPAIPVGTVVRGFPVLDQHYFFDDDGRLFVYFGTWVHNFGGYCWVEVDPSDMKTILNQGQIPMAQTPFAFEAPFMLKRNGIYFLMYSAGSPHRPSYRVMYSWSRSPTGPFTPGASNPILPTSDDGTVSGPGHHSVFRYNGNYFIAYHRHDNPKSTGGLFRQVAIDHLKFENDTTIRRVVPTHRGIGYLAEDQITATNLAFGKQATASSYYHLQNVNDDYVFYPSLTLDENNGTLWRAGTNQLPQHLIIDLGKPQNVRRVMTNFEYATFFYQYTIEHSMDGKSWAMFADRSDNRFVGSPMIDDGNAKARYLRITITATEKSGMFAAIWNVKVYDELFETPVIIPFKSQNDPAPPSTNSMLVEFNAKYLAPGPILGEIPNTGTLGGTFRISGDPKVDIHSNVKAVSFDGNDHLTLSVKAPRSLSWNSSFTISAWVLNPEVGDAECIVVWSRRTGSLAGDYAALMYGTNPGHGAAAHWGGYHDMAFNGVPEANKWHHIALTFDGMMQQIYVNGVLNNEEQKYLFVHEGSNIMIGFSGAANEYFSGSIASLRMYDKYFPAARINWLMNLDKLKTD